MLLQMCRWRSVCFLPVLSIVAGMVFSSWNHSQQALSKEAAPQVAQAALPKFQGAGSCEFCHKNGPTTDAKDDYVLLTEFKTWKEKDKHSQAFSVLRDDPRSKQIGMLLQIADVTKHDACLNCHAANVSEDRRVPGLFKIEDGVSCDACHGPSFLWERDHKFPAWRTKPMAEKESLGMADIRDPGKRSHICFSCHVGNVEQGKVITHEMYAAGHPPLPSIEVATFSDKMPRHWRYMKEKNPEIQKLFKYDPKTELEQTKLVVVSGTAALREAAEVLMGEAGQDAPKNRWPEFAQLDCYACHHDLKTESWRQKRGYAGIPGRPQIKAWPSALVKLGLRHAGSDASQVGSLQNALAAAFSAQPFGNPAAISGASKDLVKSLNEVLANLARKEYDQAAARRLLR